MKIGQFAKKHGLAVSAVRFYIELGLLMPEKKGTQYVFTPADDGELSLIKELKEMGYALKEMQKYISTVRLYQARDAALNQSLATLLREKEQDLLQQRAEIDRSLEKISEKIGFLHSHCGSSDSGENSGSSPVCTAVPLSFIPLLRCPLCGGSLQLEQATIVKSGITCAKLKCACGYEAEIRDGMLFSGALYSHEEDPDFNRCFFGTYRELSDYDSFFFESSAYSSPELMILQRKELLRLQAMLRRELPADRLIMVPDISCHQLYKLCQEPYLKQASIIVPSFTSAALLPIQKHLNKLDLNILYVINQDGLLPFSRQSVDAVVDYAGMCNFSFFNRRPFLELFGAYLRDGAEVFSATEFYAPQAKTLEAIKQTYKFSNPSVMTWQGMKQCLSRCGFKLEEQEVLGHCASPGSYWEYHLPGDKRYSICYRAKKRSAQEAMQKQP